MDLSLLAVNVAAPTPERARGLLAWAWPGQDDLWVLTETSGGEGSRLISQVGRAAGHAVHVSDRALGDGRGVMVVGRRDDLRVEVEEDVPPPAVLPGRVLPVRVTGEDGQVLRVAAVYGAASDPVRYSSAAQRQRKRAWIEAFGSWLAGWRAADPEPDGLLVGDLNLVAPGHEDPLPYVLAEETAMLAELESGHGLVDVWRAANPASTEPSWVDHSGAGCRYDHALATPDLAPRVLSCVLDQAPRLAGLTDHAALRCVLASR